MDVTTDIRVLSWNLFHGQDGARLGPTIGSTLLRRAVSDGDRLHLNRRWIPEMGAVIREASPTIAALQEVPPLAVAELGRLTGMQPAAALMAPLVGPIAFRGRLAARNPDLWRTHEGSANVLLIGDPWEVVPGGVWTVRHNPPRFVASRARRLRLRPRESAHWLLEPRRLVAARIRDPAGRTLTAVSLHCHNSHVWEVIAEEVRRVLPRVLERIPDDEPVILAGDLNAAGNAHPAVRAIRDSGLVESTTAHLELDHIFQRGLHEIAPPRALPDATREVVVRRGGRDHRVLLSDHAPLSAVFRSRVTAAV